jgi:glycosyltransferase involved in cell wall biosynthesis
LIFKSDFSKKTTNKKDSKSKNFLFVGRLEPEKNILMLVEAVNIINKKDNLSHKIIIYGDGSLKSALMDYDFVELNPFSDSEELAAQKNKIDFFCLPSSYEPWGVVVHEFAHLGLPLLLSKEVGASTEFLIEGYNGFSFNPKCIRGLVEIIRMVSCLKDTDIDLMGKRSSALANRISTEHWSNTLKSILIRSTLK